MNYQIKSINLKKNIEVLNISLYFKKLLDIVFQRAQNYVFLHG